MNGQIVRFLQKSSQKYNYLQPPDAADFYHGRRYYYLISSGAKVEEINKISCRTVAPNEVQETRTDDAVVVL